MFLFFLPNIISKPVKKILIEYFNNTSLQFDLKSYQYINLTNLKIIYFFFCFANLRDTFRWVLYIRAGYEIL